MGGIGKTALRRHLGRRLDKGSEEARWAVVDFKAPQNRTPEQALFLARNELRRKYTFRFPTFDLAYAVYWERTYAHRRRLCPDAARGDRPLPGYLSLEERETLNVLSAARTWNRALFEGLVEAFRTGDGGACSGRPGGASPSG